MVTQLFLHEQIKTTVRKADFIIPQAERIVSTVKKYDTAHGIRYLKGILRSEVASRKVLELLKQRYQNKSSGFTRKVKLGFRKGDNAEMVLLQLTE